MEKPILTITRSYNRTVQAKQYEPISAFASRTYQWFDEEPSKEEVAKQSKELFEQCVREVDRDIEAQLSRLKGFEEEDLGPAPF